SNKCTRLGGSVATPFSRRAPPGATHPRLLSVPPDSQPVTTGRSWPRAYVQGRPGLRGAGCGAGVAGRPPTDPRRRGGPGRGAPAATGRVAARRRATRLLLAAHAHGGLARRRRWWARGGGGRR